MIIGNGGVQGVANEGNPLSNVTITKVWFDLKGAPIFLRNSKNIEFRDCIVTGANRGFYISESMGITIENCTIADLTDGINTGYGPIEVIIRDSIICNNKNYGIYVSNLTKTKMIIPINPYTGDKMTTETAEKETETKIQEAEQITKVSLYYNDVWNNVYNYLNIKPGEFDISQDPKFVGEGDYHLQSSSPCIDAGDPDKKYNDSDGSRNDLGAIPYSRKR